MLPRLERHRTPRLLAFYTLIVAPTPSLTLPRSTRSAQGELEVRLVTQLRAAKRALETLTDAGAGLD